MSAFLRKIFGTDQPISSDEYNSGLVTGKNKWAELYKHIDFVLNPQKKVETVKKEIESEIGELYNEFENLSKQYFNLIEEIITHVNNIHKIESPTPEMIEVKERLWNLLANHGINQYPKLGDPPHDCKVIGEIDVGDVEINMVGQIITPGYKTRNGNVLHAAEVKVRVVGKAEIVPPSQLEIESEKKGIEKGKEMNSKDETSKAEGKKNQR